MIRKILYTLLPLEAYLATLSKLYFLTFNLGLLKSNKLYDYPYFLKNIIKKGDTCLDIGANLGYISVPLSKLVGSQGKIYAVEPVKPILKVLRKNTKSLKNIEILPYALGEENKVIQLGNDSIQEKGFLATGRSTIIKDTDKTDITFPAEMKKGSELFSNLSSLQFVKCDIEGYEIIVIPELEPVLQKHRPIILIETRGESRIQLLQFFKDREYTSFVLKEGQLYPSAESDSIDLLVVPKEKEELINTYRS